MLRSILVNTLFLVMGSYSGFHTEQVSGIASYFEHPLDVTTSQNFVAEMSQAVSQMTKLDMPDRVKTKESKSVALVPAPIFVPGPFYVPF